MKTVAIIQARTGSTRLPGKVLMDVEGETVLGHTVRRARAIAGVDEVVIATTRAPGDDRVVDEARRLGVRSYRGSEEDVLSRYLEAARLFEATVVVRITSDCPMLDPGISGRVVGRLHQSLRSEQPADYVSNIQRRCFPRGLDTEAFTLEALERADRAATGAEREHVTLHIYRHPEQFRLLSVEAGADHSNHRWTVDTPEDLELVRQVYKRLGSHTFTWMDALGLFEREPDLAAINAGIEQKKVEVAR